MLYFRHSSTPPQFPPVWARKERNMAYGVWLILRDWIFIQILVSLILGLAKKRRLQLLDSEIFLSGNMS
jgi:hypothetical protein